MNRKLDSNPFISKLKLSGTQIVVILSFAESNLKNKLKKHRISCRPNLLDDFQGKLKQMVSFYHKNTLVILSGLGEKEEFQKLIKNFMKLSAGPSYENAFYAKNIFNQLEMSRDCKFSSKYIEYGRK